MRRSPCAATGCTSSSSKLFNIALPRVRDFRGVDPTSPSTAAATMHMGIKEQLIFPEIDYDKVDKVRGMDMIFVTTAHDATKKRRELLAPDGHAVHEVRRRTITWLRTVMINKQQKEPKFSTRAYTRCQHVRPSALRAPQVRHLPHLFPRAGVQGRDSRRPQGQLVSEATKKEVELMLIPIPLQICSRASAMRKVAKHDTVDDPGFQHEEVHCQDPARRRLHQERRYDRRRPCRPDQDRPEVLPTRSRASSLASSASASRACAFTRSARSCRRCWAAWALRSCPRPRA